MAAGGNAAGGKHPGSGGVGLCSRERFKQLLRGLWRTHFTDGQAESLADRYLVSVGDSAAVKVRGGEGETEVISYPKIEIKCRHKKRKIRKLSMERLLPSPYVGVRKKGLI